MEALNSGLCLENKSLLAMLISVFLKEIKWGNSLNKAEQEQCVELHGDPTVCPAHQHGRGL